MSIGTNLISGVKFINQGFSFLLQNKKLLLYLAIPAMLFVGVGFLYFHPIIKAIMATGNPGNIQSLFAAKPELLKPTPLAIATFAIMTFFATMSLALLINHTAYLINPGSTSPHSVRTLLEKHWLNFSLWLLIIGVISYFSGFLAPQGSIQGTIIGIIIMLFYYATIFTFQYMVIKDVFVFDAIIASMRLVWQKLAYVVGAYIWLLCITLALILVPIATLTPLGDSARIIAAILAFFGIFTALAGGAVGFTMIFLSAHNELPGMYDPTKTTLG